MVFFNGLWVVVWGPIRVSITRWGDLLALRVLINGLSMAVWTMGPYGYTMVFPAAATRGAIQVSRVLFIGLWVALEGPMVFPRCCHKRGCTDSPGWCSMVPEWYSMGLGWNPVPYDELYKLSGCCSMVLALSGKIDKPPSKVTLLTIFGHICVIQKKGSFWACIFFGDSRNPLQYSGVGHTPQISHMQRSHGETLAYTP